MPTIIQQGAARIFVQPGVLVGVSEEDNTEIMENQREWLKETKGDSLTASLLEPEDEGEFLDDIL